MRLRRAITGLTVVFVMVTGKPTNQTIPDMAGLPLEPHITANTTISTGVRSTITLYAPQEGDG